VRRGRRGGRDRQLLRGNAVSSADPVRRNVRTRLEVQQRLVRSRFDRPPSHLPNRYRCSRELRRLITHAGCKPIPDRSRSQAQIRVSTCVVLTCACDSGANQSPVADPLRTPADRLGPSPIWRAAQKAMPHARPSAVVDVHNHAYTQPGQTTGCLPRRVRHTAKGVEGAVCVCPLIRDGRVSLFGDES